MKNLVCMIIVLLAFASGCSMCCGPFDYDYPTFGGKHQRADRSYGRVGSALSDPGRTLFGPSADSNLTPPPEPTSSEPDDDDDDDTIDLDSLDEPDLDSDVESKLKELDRELEGIEPLRNGDSAEPSGAEDDGNPTASNRWHLKQRYQVISLL
jgi:hypothetical protein